MVYRHELTGMTTDEVKDRLREVILSAIDDARDHRVSSVDVLGVMSEIYEEVTGAAYLADHYGGDLEVPPRIVSPPPRHVFVQLIRRV
jgi:hypothetical protein